MMDVIAETIDFYEKEADRYIQINKDINEIKERIDFFVNNLPGVHILDVGCGPGREAGYFCKKGLKVTGIDLADNFICKAKETARDAEILKMDMRELTFSDNRFDGIWACASFLHIPKNEAQKTLEGLNRVLKKGGLLYLSVKSGDSEKLVESFQYSRRKRFFAFWQDEEILNLLKSCHFNITKVFIIQNENRWINIFAEKEANTIP